MSDKLKVCFDAQYWYVFDDIAGAKKRLTCLKIAS
jgi:hypothetical protein